MHIYIYIYISVYTYYSILYRTSCRSASRTPSATPPASSRCRSPLSTKQNITHNTITLTHINRSHTHFIDKYLNNK